MGQCNQVENNPSNHKNFGAKQHKPMDPKLEKDLDNARANYEKNKQQEAAAIRSELVDNVPASPAREISETEIRMQKAKQRSRSAAHGAIDTNADTVETLDRQIEQTRADNRKLVHINDKLAEAEGYLAELNMGMWNITSKGNKFPLPAVNDNDIEVPVTMNKGIFNQHERWTLRFTHTVMMMITKNQELEATVAYRQITRLFVRSMAGYCDIYLDSKSLKSKDEFITVCADTETAYLVRTLYRLKLDVTDEELPVAFESGAEKFDYFPPPSKGGRMQQTGGRTGGSRPSSKPKKQDPWGLDAEDSFADETLGDLDVLLNQGHQMKHQFDTHMTELKKQDELVKETRDRTKHMTTEAYKTDKFIGGKGGPQDQPIIPDPTHGMAGVAMGGM